MNTATGRRLAEERAAFVEQFCAQFVAEIGVAACTER
jgi:HD superfamily phosphodiesterase